MMNQSRRSAAVESEEINKGFSGDRKGITGKDKDKASREGCEQKENKGSIDNLN